jgi:flavodoxin
MKSIRVFFLLALSLCLALSCKEKEEGFVQFVRECGEFNRNIYDDNGEFEYSYPFNLTVDVPVNGPSFLRDSITAFLNKSIHKACELICDDDGSPILKLDNIAVKKPVGITKHYLDAYKPFLDKLLTNSYAMTLTAVAQRDSFITYGLEFHHCGASCGAEFLCYSFSKKDGHLVTVVNQEELDKYFKEHPEMVADFYEGDYQGLLDYGLMDDGILEIMQDVANNHYAASPLSNPEALMIPFLTQEARQLLQDSGSFHEFREWSLGTAIGEAEMNDGTQAVLMKKVSQWDCFEEVDLDDYYDDFSFIRPFKVEKGQYVALDENDYRTLAFIGKTKDYLIRLDFTTTDYRYSAWKGKDDMFDEPDLVIDGGSFDSYEGLYTFENKGYTYSISMLPIFEEEEFTLIVSQNGRELLSQSGEIYDYTNLAHINHFPLGEVTCSDGSTIRLLECAHAFIGAYISEDYYVMAVSDSTTPTLKEVFEKKTESGETYYQAFTDTVEFHSFWLSSEPEGRFHAFNIEDRTLYCACGDDRFDVYQFDGTHFTFVKEDGGFWLHPSIRTFNRLINVYETNNYIIRVDEETEGRYRYSSWKKANDSDWDMSREPDLVIHNGKLETVEKGYTEYNIASFDNDEYRYIVDESEHELTVLKDSKEILNQACWRAIHRARE